MALLKCTVTPFQPDKPPKPVSRLANAFMQVAVSTHTEQLTLYVWPTGTFQLQLYDYTLNPVTLEGAQGELRAEIMLTPRQFIELNRRLRT
jgi:hypothetical protein